MDRSSYGYDLMSQKNTCKKWMFLSTIKIMKYLPLKRPESWDIE